MIYRVHDVFALSRNGDNPKIRSCDLDLWSMTLKFSGFRAVVKEHVRAEFHQTKCSGSWVIVRTEKKNSDEKKNNNTVRRFGGQWRSDGGGAVAPSDTCQRAVHWGVKKPVYHLEYNKS